MLLFPRKGRGFVFHVITSYFRAWPLTSFSINVKKYTRLAEKQLHIYLLFNELLYHDSILE
jgi:hypothetical protein